MLVFPERVLAGDIPNKDFLHLYGPGSLWVLAGVYKVFGTQLVVERLFALLAADRHRARHVRAGPVLGPDRRALLRRDRARHHRAADRAHRARLGRRRRARAPRPARDAARPAHGCGTDAERRRCGWALVGGILVAASRSSSGSTSSSRSGSALLAAWWGTDRRFKLRLAHRLRDRRRRLPRAHRDGRARQRRSRAWSSQPVFDLRGGRRLPVPPPWDHFDGFLQKSGAIMPGHWPLPALATSAQLTVWFFAAARGRGVPRRRRRSGPCARTAARFQARVLLAVALFSLGHGPPGDAAGRLRALRLGQLRAVRVRCPSRCSSSCAAARRSWSFRRQRGPQPARGAFARDDPRDPAVHRRGRTRTTSRRRSAGTGSCSRSSTTAGPSTTAARRSRRPRRELLAEVPEGRASRATGSSSARRTCARRRSRRRTSTTCSPSYPPATYYIEMDPGVANAKGSGLASDLALAPTSRSCPARGTTGTSRTTRASSAPTRRTGCSSRDFCLVGEYGVHRTGDPLYQLFIRRPRRRAVPGRHDSPAGPGDAEPAPAEEPASAALRAEQAHPVADAPPAHEDHLLDHHAERHLRVAAHPVGERDRHLGDACRPSARPGTSARAGSRSPSPGWSAYSTALQRVGRERPEAGRVVVDVGAQHEAGVEVAVAATAPCAATASTASTRRARSATRSRGRRRAVDRGDELRAAPRGRGRGRRRSGR